MVVRRNYERRKYDPPYTQLGSHISDWYQTSGIMNP